MTAPGLFVALVRAGGLLFAVHGAISAASTWGSGFPGRTGYVVAAFALALIGIGLVVAAPAISRLLSWPDTPPEVDPLADDATAVPGRFAWGRIAARVVGLIAVVEIIRPFSRLAHAVWVGESLVSKSMLQDTIQFVGLAVAAATLLLLSRRPSAST